MSMSTTHLCDHCGTVAELFRLQDQLAAVTAARDEACDIAFHWLDPMCGDWHVANERIATLREVGR